MESPAKKPRLNQPDKIRHVFDDLEHVSKRTAKVPVQALPEGCPKRWSKLVGNRFTKQQLRDYARSVGNKLVLLHGPTGVGKTSACRLAFQKTAWIHDIRSIGTPILPRLERLVKSKRHYPQEVVVLDPLEEVLAVGGAQDAKKLCALIANAIQKQSGLGFVLVADNIYTRAMYPIRCNSKLPKMCLRMYPIEKKDMRTLLISAGIMGGAEIKQGIEVANGDGRKAKRFAKNKEHRADVTLNKFETCDAVIAGDKERARTTENVRTFLQFWEANIPTIALGHDNKDPTGVDMDTYFRLLDCASFADLTTTMYRHDYAMEATLACAKTARLYPIPMGKAVYPKPPVFFDQNRTQIRKKCKMMGIKPEELHDHVSTLQMSLKKEPDSQTQVRRMQHIDTLHKRWGVSADIGQLSLEMQFAKNTH